MVPTEENCDVRHLFDDHVQHLVGDVFYVVALLLLFEPLEDFLLVLQIPFVIRRYSLLEVQETRYLVDSVFFRFVDVVNFHENYPQLVALVVDVLQLAQDALRFPIVVVVCDN